MFQGKLYLPPEENKDDFQKSQLYDHFHLKIPKPKSPPSIMNPFNTDENRTCNIEQVSSLRPNDDGRAISAMHEDATVGSQSRRGNETSSLLGNASFRLSSFSPATTTLQTNTMMTLSAEEQLKLTQSMIAQVLDIISEGMDFESLAMPYIISHDQ